MADYAVSTVFTAKDSVSDKMNAMGNAVDRFGDRAHGAFAKAGQAGLSFKTLVGGILTSNLVSRGIGLLSSGIRNAASDYIDFDDAITAAAAHMGDGFARGSETFKGLSAAAREVGATTEYSAVQAAKGLDFLAKAGLEPTFAMKTLKSYVDLATASGEEFEAATSMAVDIMGAFRLNTGTAEEQITKFKRANDVLTKTVNMSNIGLADLFETIKYSGPMAVDAGVSLEKYGAIVAFVGGAGLKGSVAGTGVKNILLNMAANAKAFQKIGINTKNLKGNVRDPLIIFDELQKKLSKFGNAKKLETLKDLFGLHAISDASALMAGGMKALSKYETALKNAAGETTKTSELMRASIGKRLDILKASAMELAFKFIDAFEKKIPGGIDKLTESLRNFDMKPVVEATMKFGEGLITVCKIAKELLPIIEGLAAGFVAYRTATVGAEIVVAYTKIAGAIKAAGSAQAAFNIVLAANPIGAAVVAIGLMTAACVMLYQQLDGIKEILTWIGDKWSKLKEDNVWMSLGNDTAVDESVNDALDKSGFGKYPSPDSNKSVETPSSFTNKYGYESTAPWDAKQNGFQVVYPSLNSKREAPTQTRIAPNRNDVSQQNINFRGELDIKGAPPGSTLRTRTIGAPPVRAELAGANQ
jgi:TP901 family phage tail tape measure protein